MKKVMSLLLALLMVLGLLTTTAWADPPEGTGPMFFCDDKQEKYYDGTRIDRGETKVFSKVYYSNDPDYIEITGGEVTTTASGLKASLTNGALTVQADTDCTLGEQFVIVTTDGSVKYAMRFNVSEGGGGQGGPPFAGTVRSFITKNFTEAQGVWSTAQEASAIAAEWGSFDNEAHRFALEQYPWLGQVLSSIGIVVPITKTYILSADTAIDITVPECLSGIVILPDALAPNNVLTVKFKDGITAEDWKNVYNGSMMRDFAMLSYTFRYIGEMKNPKYYTWNAQNGDSVAAAAAKAAEKCSYGYDRGISNAIVVAKFQDDGEMMVLPGNTNVNATSHEIISWEGTGGYSYLTDVVDTSNVSAMMLDIKQSADYGTQGNWLDKLGSPTDSSRVSLPQVDGVTMTVYNGLVRTAFDTTKTLNVEQVLAAAVSITAPDGAVQYRMVNNYTSTEPNEHCYVSLQNIAFAGDGGVGLETETSVYVRECRFTGWTTAVAAEDGGWIRTWKCRFEDNGTALLYHSGRCSEFGPQMEDNVFRHNGVAVDLEDILPMVWLEPTNCAFEQNGEDIRNPYGYPVITVSCTYS